MLAETLAFDTADWDTFEDVVALLTEREAWSQLDRAYRPALAPARGAVA